MQDVLPLDISTRSDFRPTWLLLRTARIFLALASVMTAFVLSLGGCRQYDVLVDKEQVCDQKWADLDAQLQRRYDLVPNLVATVRGSAAHEENTLRQVTEARSQAASIRLNADDLNDPEKMAAFQKAQDNLRGSLSRLLVVQEQYPDLKANQAFHDLQVQLEGTENRILRAREQYNAAVADYNAELRRIGGSALNRVTGRPFQPRPFFNATAGANTPPVVSF